MAPTTALFLLLALSSSLLACAADPDITTDFLIPANETLDRIDGNFFTYTGMRALFNDGGDDPKTFQLFKATAAEFPALMGQSVSYAVLIYPAGTVNPPHTHPRSAELLFLVSGLLDVGFVDTTNKLYTHTLQPGDMFVFPKGLVHFQYSAGQDTAVAVSAFGSASAGTVSVPGSVFTSGIDDGVLAKSFKTDVGTIQKIKSGLAPKA